VTQTSSAPTLKVGTVAEAITALRASGLRLSASRRIVLEVLFQAEAPLSADQIAEGITDRVPSSDIKSVYRNLEALEKLGLIRHTHLGHGPGLYALSGQGEREYLVCERCRKVTPVDPAQLDAIRSAIRERFGFAASFTHFPITGLCETCQVADDVS
jgi:Fur family ferric uptake transcriptional regulator